MDKPREKLFKILCPVWYMESAVKILGKLVEAKESGEEWCSKDEIGLRTESDELLISKLDAGNLINITKRQYDTLYSVSQQGEELYRQLAGRTLTR